MASSIEITEPVTFADGFAPGDRYLSDRDRIKGAFKALRKRGYGCRANFMCCGRCAGVALDAKHKGKKGVVYYSRQGEIAYGEPDSYYGKSNFLVNTLYLSWSGDGYEIAEVLRMHGLRVWWPEDDTACIGISRAE